MDLFRPATPEDLPAIVALLADDALGRTREDPQLPLKSAYTDAFAAISRDPNQLLAVAEQDGAIVGCLQITFIPGLSRMGLWRGQIESVRVAEACRGQGLGQRMISWAIDRCRERGCGVVQLTSDVRRPEAHRFYERLGFEATHVGMKLDLSRS
jgi:ribosomal protein S18 acetylase RimI-like enzyme